jgi:hypothetical protein
MGARAKNIIARTQIPPRVVTRARAVACIIAFLR